MKISLKRIGDDFLFEGRNKNGHSILLDNTSQPNAQGVSPMESLLMAVAACSGIDVVAILKKQRQEIAQFTTEVEGERIEKDEAKPFSKIWVHFHLEGNIDPIKALKAAQLSFDKYCSVSKTFEPQVEILFSVTVNGTLVEK
ncbi:MAG: OsmC family protein [Bacteroidetes bacterium]|nr:OsmC family protein [Bacteroidota bacterium]